MHLRNTHQFALNHNTDFQASQKLSSAKDQLMKQSPYVLIGILAGLVIIIIIIICCIYRRYMTRKLYGETPQNFSYRPQLGWIQRRRFEKSQMISLTSPVGQQITVKQDYEGLYHEIKFKNSANCLYYHHRLVDSCYFEIEFIKINSVVQIGFVHKEDIQTNLCKRQDGKDKEEAQKKKGRFFSKKTIKTQKQLQEQEAQGEDKKQVKYQIQFDQYGVSVKTDGTIVAYGITINTIRWSLQYGDVIGIGMTKHEGNRRVWITRNGVLMNPPTQQQMLQQMPMDGEQVQAVSKKAVVEESSQQKEKKQKEAAKLRVQLKTTKKFAYYAVIASQSSQENGQNDGQNEQQKQTVIHLNVGAHKFRLFDGNKLKGLLNK